MNKIKGSLNCINIMEMPQKGKQEITIPLATTNDEAISCVIRKQTCEIHFSLKDNQDQFDVLYEYKQLSKKLQLWNDEYNSLFSLAASFVYSLLDLQLFS